VDRTQIHPREVFRFAIRENCSRVLLVHNHPSGDPTPSAQDIAANRQLVEAGKIVGIEVLDHVIVANPARVHGRAYVSFRQENLM
jgi:DNA repair protein RadC